MKDWISLFEKYRIDRRLLDLHRSEFACLREDSPRRKTLAADIAQLERAVLGPELLLSRYDEQVSSPRDALQRADERLFLACHYIKGLTMEDTAAEMCVSRDTVYRIRRRVIARGEVPALPDFALSGDEVGNIGDARRSVIDVDALRRACFAPAGKDARISVESAAPSPSPVKERGYPDFIFTAK